VDMSNMYKNAPTTNTISVDLNLGIWYQLEPKMASNEREV
jgi:hypothetical protein